VRGDFIEPVDPVHGEHASLLIDGELVVLGRVDLFAVKQPDNEHDAVLSSERSLARPYGRLGVGFDPLLGGGVNGAETLHDNQSRARPRRHRSPRGLAARTGLGSGIAGAQTRCSRPAAVKVTAAKKWVGQRLGRQVRALPTGAPRLFIG
jgi:hypothetical protein